MGINCRQTAGRTFPPSRRVIEGDDVSAQRIHSPSSSAFLSPALPHSPLIGVSSSHVTYAGPGLLLRYISPLYHCSRSLPMSSKPPATSPGSSGSVALALHPPSIDLSNKLLFSAISLSPNTSIACAVFSPTTSPTHHPDTIEIARKHVLDTGKSSLIDSLLCTVHVEKSGQQLYVFSVGSSDGTGDPLNRLNGLQFDGLTCESFKYVIRSTRIAHLDPFLPFLGRTVLTSLPHTVSQTSHFRPTEIHDSKSASLTRNTSSTPQHSIFSPQSTEHSLSFPEENLRIPYTLFIKAVQERLINDICSVQDHDRILCRLNGGFLIFPQHPTSGWGTGWEHHAQNRYESYFSD